MKAQLTQFTTHIPAFKPRTNQDNESTNHEHFVRCTLFGNPELPTIAILGGISANQHVTDDPLTKTKGWWSNVVNSGEFLSGQQFSILSFEYITYKNPKQVPSTYDQAHVLATIQKQLNIQTFLAIIGCSYGGMVAQAFTSAYPHLTQSLICLVSAHKNTLHSQALRLVQRQILNLNNTTSSQQTAIARSLALLTYRETGELDQRFNDLSEVTSYLEHNSLTFAKNFSPHRYAQLSASIDHHQIDPQKITVPTLLIGTDSDQLVPAALIQSFANQIPAVTTCHIIKSVYGHDGFLKDTQTIMPLLADFLSQISTKPLIFAKPPHNRINTMKSNTFNAQTTAVRAGIDSDTQHGAVTPALHLSSNYSFAGFKQPRQYDYSRSGNPTRDLLAEALSELEHAAGGVITATGMAAVTLVTQLVSHGGLVIAPHDCYGGTYRLLSTLSEKGLIKVQFLDQSNHQKVSSAIEHGAELLWIETPSNPLLRVVDVQALCELAGNNVLKVVDNTFLSPAFQQPLELGADLVIHSTTKYINGHSDVVGGAVLAKTPELAEQIKWWANCIGITAAPFDCLLTLRGLRTLHIRLQQHVKNTETVIDLLQNHEAVGTIYYPGLKDHPGHLIAKKQQKGYGAMLSFELLGSEQQVRQFLSQLQVFTLAESLGGVESLVCHPATMTHAAMTPEAQIKAGISGQLLRLSLGIEYADDLLSDLKEALDSCIEPDDQIGVTLNETHPISNQNTLTTTQRLNHHG